MDEPGCFSTKSEEYFQYSQPCRGPWLLSLYSLPYTHILIFQASICKVARWISKKNLWIVYQNYKSKGLLDFQNLVSLVLFA